MAAYKLKICMPIALFIGLLLFYINKSMKINDGYGNLDLENVLIL